MQDSRRSANRIEPHSMPRPGTDLKLPPLVNTHFEHLHNAGEFPQLTYGNSCAVIRERTAVKVLVDSAQL